MTIPIQFISEYIFFLIYAKRGLYCLYVTKSLNNPNPFNPNNKQVTKKKT